MQQILFALVAILSLLATVLWSRSADGLKRVWTRTATQFGEDSEVAYLASSRFQKELHTAMLYAAVAVASGVYAIVGETQALWAFALILIPAIATAIRFRDASKVASLSLERLEVERRAEETLSQDELAPKAWAGRLAPDALPDLNGFEIGRVYQPGSGLMAGDFFDVFRLNPNRIAAVLGDVAGHGIESSITAFQAKYLLRVFLRQYRDPAQALEELNTQMSAMDRGEEFISLVAVVFDTAAGALRFASAGHPAAYLWHEKEVRPLRATGPLVMLDPEGEYFSREIPLAVGDVCLMYTDGLAEARSGANQFGEERIATALRRDPGVSPDVLCKSLLEAARDFSDGPIDDDVAILAIRRT